MHRIKLKETTNLHSLNTAAGRRHVKAQANSGLYSVIRRLIQIDTIACEPEKKNHLALSKNPANSVVYSHMLVMCLLTLTFMPVALFSEYQKEGSETHKVINELAQKAGFSIANN